MSVEEWWGRTVEGRGKLHRNEDWSPRNVRRRDTVDLLEMVRSEDTRSVRGLLSHIELRRRENWTARAALLVSILGTHHSRVRCDCS